jgi:hypothetical protein
MSAILRRFAGLVALFLAASTYSHATTVEVPFTFEANGMQLPAGSYDVNLDVHHRYVIVSSKEYAAKQFIVFVRSTQPNTLGSMMLSFDQTGTVPVLRQIRDVEWSTPDISHTSSKALTEKRLSSGE